MYYHTRSPVASIAEGVRDHFGNDIVRAVHIGIDLSACCCVKEATFDALAQIRRVFANHLTIEKAALAGVALLSAVNRDTYQRRLVLQHRNESSMRQHYKVLIGSLAKCDSLFPAIILANDQRADAMDNKLVNNAAAGDMQVTVDLTPTLVRQSIKTARGVLAHREFGLQLRAAFVVPLVQRFERTTVNQKRRKAGLD